MKKFQFLLLDAGPIIKLFKLGIWDNFIEHCEVTIVGTVAEEAERNIKKILGVCAHLESYNQKGLIQIVEIEISVIKEFYSRFDLSYRGIIDPGEKETLAHICNTTETWFVCSADGAVFRALAVLGKASQGISLEELLSQIGLSQSSMEWQYSRKFREKYTRMGQVDAIQDKGIR